MRAATVAAAATPPRSRTRHTLPLAFLPLLRIGPPDGARMHRLAARPFLARHCFINRSDSALIVRDTIRLTSSIGCHDSTFCMRSRSRSMQAQSPDPMTHS